MASRKLKFKPKPTVNTSVRRPREKVDVPELISKEPLIDEQEKQVIQTCITDTFPDVNQNERITSSVGTLGNAEEDLASTGCADNKKLICDSVPENENLTHHKTTISAEGILNANHNIGSSELTLNSINDQKEVLSLHSTNINHKQSIQPGEKESSSICSVLANLGSDTGVQNLALNNNCSILHITHADEPISSPLNTTTENDTNHKQNHSIGTKQNILKELEPDCNKVGNVSVVVSSSSKENEVANQSSKQPTTTIKSETLKGLSRFGRARYKPVLNTRGLNKATECDTPQCNTNDKQNDSIGIKEITVKEPEPDSCKVSNVSVVESSPHKENDVANQSSKQSTTTKSESLKCLSRFGRSRCKPVLNKARKKNDIEQSGTDAIDAGNLQIQPESVVDGGKVKLQPDSIVFEDSVKQSDTVVQEECIQSGTIINKDTVRQQTVSDLNKENLKSQSEIVTCEEVIRTESVIKHLDSQLDKAKSIAKEITESFSLLECEEPEDLFGNHKSLVSIETIEQESREIIIHSDTKSRSGETKVWQFELKNTNYDSPPSKNSESNTFFIKPILKNNGKPTDKFIIENLSSNGNANIMNDKVKGSNENNADVSSSLSNKIPTSPLKPPSKILVPKPSPRISEMHSRRMSFQGSDSEEETKRKQSANSESSKSLQKEKKQNSLQNKKRKRSQGSTYTKMGQDTLEKFSKKFGKETPDKTKLTMIDLIFYNPKCNPMSTNSLPIATIIKKKEEKLEISQQLAEVLDEQNVDDVEAATIPVPQLKVGPDGQVMLDPQSLVIETTGSEQNRAKLENSEVIQETGGLTRYRTYSKRKIRRNDWTALETLQFYKALNTVGSDFTLMTQLFPNRTRHDLKLKFKREEKANLHLIDKAMTSQSDFDFKALEAELKSENEAVASAALLKQQKKEAQKEERARMKEERLKNKKTHCKKMRRSFAMKDFHEMYDEEPPMRKQPTKKRGKKKKATGREIELLDSDSDVDLQIALDSDSLEEKESMAVLKMVRETTFGRLPKRENNLVEYEEINETLKKKMRHESESEDELYTPNGHSALMLYGTPEENPTQETDEGQWNIQVSSLPTIEETVLLDSVENVSELSELGSFGQTDSALDLSMPLRNNIQQHDLLQENQACGSLLSGQIISESIKIIDQLTANVDHECEYKDNDGITSEIVVGDSCQNEEGESILPLPGFESVSQSRPLVVYPLQTPHSPDCNNHGSEVQNASNEPSIVLSNYYNSEECILGGD